MRGRQAFSPMASQTSPYRCKKLICKSRNTALFSGKVSLKGIFLDVTGNGVQKQCENIVLWLV